MSRRCSRHREADHLGLPLPACGHAPSGSCRHPSTQRHAAPGWPSQEAVQGSRPRAVSHPACSFFARRPRADDPVSPTSQTRPPTLPAALDLLPSLPSPSSDVSSPRLAPLPRLPSGRLPQGQALVRQGRQHDRARKGRATQPPDGP